MARGRVRLKQWGFPALSYLSLVCGSALLSLAVLSVAFTHLLDGGVHHRTGPTSKNLVSVVKELRKLNNVPRTGEMVPTSVWRSEKAEFYYGCSAPSNVYAPASSFGVNGYLMIQASGGLNQQRTGIIDAVVVARILNATLVVPELDHTSFWQDNSNFSDIFDVDHFISAVAPDVRVIKRLPFEVEKNKPAYRMSVPRKSSPEVYQSRVLPKLLSRQVLKLTKFDYRLSSKLDEDLQKLRCRVNYEALLFTRPIAHMGQMLVERMRRKGGRYIALHLRFEPDMLAFSGCYYGGGPEEEKELGAIRKRWKNLPALDADKARRNGKCPLSPTEVGLLLRASGYGDDTHLFVASGEVYHGEESLAPLKVLFPKFYTKESLATEEELKPFQKFSSRMAAIDYIVCDESDVFVANNNGNMARILAGHRRFSGHKQTIRPNAKKLSPLFASREELGWEHFAERVRHFQKGFMGAPYEGKPGRGDFHENPASCICKKSDYSVKSPSHEHGKRQGDFGPTDKRLDTKWADTEDDFDVEDVGIDSEDDIVRTEFLGEAVLDAGKDDAKLDARLEEVEVEEVTLSD